MVKQLRVLVVLSISYVFQYLEMVGWSTNMFQRRWNNQPDLPLNVVKPSLKPFANGDNSLFGWLTNDSHYFEPMSLTMGCVTIHLNLCSAKRQLLNFDDVSGANEDIGWYMALARINGISGGQHGTYTSGYLWMAAWFRLLLGRARLGSAPQVAYTFGAAVDESWWNQPPADKCNKSDMMIFMGIQCDQLVHL